MTTRLLLLLTLLTASCVVGIAPSPTPAPTLTHTVTEPPVLPTLTTTATNTATPTLTVTRTATNTATPTLAATRTVTPGATPTAEEPVLIRCVPNSYAYLDEYTILYKDEELTRFDLTDDGVVPEVWKNQPVYLYEHGTRRAVRWVKTATNIIMEGWIDNEKLPIECR